MDESRVNSAPLSIASSYKTSTLRRGETKQWIGKSVARLVFVRTMEFGVSSDGYHPWLNAPCLLIASVCVLQIDLKEEEETLRYFRGIANPKPMDF